MKKDVKELGKKTRFSGEYAVRCAKNSVIAREKKKAEAKIVKDELLKKMGEKDWDELIHNVIERAKTNKADMELLLGIIGQKPIDKQQMDIRATATIEEFIDGLGEK